MNEHIITICNEIRLKNEKILIGKEDKDFLLDRENPYFGMENKEKKLLIFAIFEKIHYGILRSNLLCVIEEKFKTYIGDIFNNIEGIYNYPFNKSYFFYLLNKKDKKRGKEFLAKFDNSHTKMDVAGLTPDRMVYSETPLSYTHTRGENGINIVSEWTSVAATTCTTSNATGQGEEMRNTQRAEMAQQREIARGYMERIAREAQQL